MRALLSTDHLPFGERLPGRWPRLMLISTCAHGLHRAGVQAWELPFMDVDHVLASWPWLLALACVVYATILFLAEGSLMVLLKLVNMGAAACRRRDDAVCGAPTRRQRKRQRQRQRQRASAPPAPPPDRASGRVRPRPPMQRSRRNVPQNSKQGALAQLRAIKSGDAKRSDQFEVRLPLIAPSAVIAEAIVPGVGSPWLWCLCSSKQRAISTRTWERMSTRRL